MEKRDAKVTPVKTAVAKPAAETKEEAVKAEVKETAETAGVKTEKSEATVENVTEDTKKEAVKKETTKKEAPAKKTARKSPAKKTEAKKIEKVEEVYLQYQDKEIVTKDILEKAKQAYIAEGHRESSIKSIRLYIKPEENMAYYVINEKAAGGVSL